MHITMRKEYTSPEQVMGSLPGEFLKSFDQFGIYF